MYVQGIISCSVQLYFAQRVRLLTGYSFVALAIAFLAFGGFCA
jgi:hypothetical protein